MLWRDIGYLCKPIMGLDAMRRPTKTGYDKREVMCNDKGVKRTEFYQAATAGIKPERSIELKACEYQNEEYFEYDGVLYRVLRTYPTKAECIELTLIGLVKDNV